MPGGARAAAMGLALGGSPPPGCPGCGTLEGATPGGGTMLMGGCRGGGEGVVPEKRINLCHQFLQYFILYQL